MAGRITLIPAPSRNNKLNYMVVKTDILNLICDYRIQKEIAEQMLARKIGDQDFQAFHRSAFTFFDKFGIVTTKEAHKQQLLKEKF
jgi:hypothetical protein